MNAWQTFVFLKTIMANVCIVKEYVAIDLHADRLDEVQLRAGKPIKEKKV